MRVFKKRIGYEELGEIYPECGQHHIIGQGHLKGEMGESQAAEAFSLLPRHHVSCSAFPWPVCIIVRNYQSYELK